MKRVLNKTQSSSIFTMHGLPHLIQYCWQILPGVLHLKLVQQQADLVERGLQHSRTRSCWPLPRNPPSPPSPSSQRVPDGHQEIKALDQSFSSTIVRDPLSLLLGYLRGWLSRICCGDIFWSVPALSGTVSPLSGLGRSVSWPARVSGACTHRASPGHQAATKP